MMRVKTNELTNTRYEPNVGDQVTWHGTAWAGIDVTSQDTLYMIGSGGIGICIGSIWSRWGTYTLFLSPRGPGHILSPAVTKV